MMTKAIAVLVVLVTLATPAAAQHAHAADVASNVVVSAQLVADSIDSWRSRNRSNAFACQAIRLIATIGAAELLKRTIQKERPDGSDRKSFPSMHTGVAMESMGWNWRFGVPLAITTGGLRIAARKHDVIDVAAGAGVGYLSHQLCERGQ